MAYVGVPETLSPAQLSAAREAFVARVDAAAERVMRGNEMEGMPYRLVDASCFLAAAGVAAPASAGEFFFNWDLSVSCQFLDGLAAAAREEQIAEGYQAFVAGKRPICPDIAEYRRQTAQIVDLMETRWAANSAAYFARLDAGKAA